MADRVYWYAESLARSTTTTTNWSAVKVTLSFTPNASKTYAIFWASICDGSTASSQYTTARLQHVTATSTLETLVYPTHTTSAKFSFGGLVFYTSTASPTSQTFEIQYASESAGHTAGISEATLFILELTDNDELVESTGASNSVSGTYETKTTLTFTPPSAGDYVVVAHATFGSSDGATDGKVRLWDNVASVGYEIIGILYNWGVDAFPCHFMARVTNVSAQQTFRIEWARTAGAGNAILANARLLALRLSDFDANYWDEDRTSHGSTSATYVDSDASITATPAAVDHLVLASGMACSSTTDFSSLTGVKINAGGSDVGTTFIATAGYNTSTYFTNWFQVRKRTEAAQSTTWKLQYARVGGAGTAYSDEMALAVLQLQTAGTLVPERLAPDSIAASTNLAGAVTAIDEDPDSPDANWLTATSATAVTDCRVTFPTPTANPSGAQNFRLQLRKTTGTPTPTVDVLLYQNAASVATLLNDQAITSTTGEVVQGDWTASQLTGTTDGSDVECRVVSTVGSSTTVGALPAYAATGQAAAVVDATITNAITPAKPSTVNAGDLLILHVLARNNNSDGAGPATISGWTAFAGNPYGGTNNARQSIYWRIAGAGEASQTVSVTCTGGTTSDLAMARIYRFTAANGFDAAPIEAINSTAGTTATLAAPTVTPTGANRRAVCLGAIASSDATIGSMTGESGGNWTEAVTANSIAGGDGSLNVQTSDQSGGGAISGGSIAFTTSTSAHWTSVGFALVPSSSVTPVNTVEIGAIEWNAQYISAGNNQESPLLAQIQTGFVPKLALKAQAPKLTQTQTVLVPKLSVKAQAPKLTQTQTPRVPTLTLRYPSAKLTITQTPRIPTLAFKYSSVKLTQTQTPRLPTLRLQCNAPKLTQTQAFLAPQQPPSQQQAPLLALIQAPQTPNVQYQEKPPVLSLAQTPRAPTLQSKYTSPKITSVQTTVAPKLSLNVRPPVLPLYFLLHAEYEDVLPALEFVQSLKVPKLLLRYNPPKLTQTQTPRTPVLSHRYNAPRLQLAEALQAPSAALRYTSPTLTQAQTPRVASLTLSAQSPTLAFLQTLRGPSVQGEAAAVLAIVQSLELPTASLRYTSSSLTQAQTPRVPSLRYGAVAAKLVQTQTPQVPTLRLQYTSARLAQEQTPRVSSLTFKVQAPTRAFTQTVIGPSMQGESAATLAVVQTLQPLAAVLRYSVAKLSQTQTAVNPSLSYYAVSSKLTGVETLHSPTITQRYPIPNILAFVHSAPLPSLSIRAHLPVLAVVMTGKEAVIRWEPIPTFHSVQTLSAPTVVERYGVDTLFQTQTNVAPFALSLVRISTLPQIQTPLIASIKFNIIVDTLGFDASQLSPLLYRYYTIPRLAFTQAYYDAYLNIFIDVDAVPSAAYLVSSLVEYRNIGSPVEDRMVTSLFEYRTISGIVEERVVMG